MEGLKKGAFIQVGSNTDSIGVVVFLENEYDSQNNIAIPEEHIGVWYGEMNETGLPKYRTVPITYCQPIKKWDMYH